MGKEDKNEERERARDSQAETHREENVTEVRIEKYIKKRFMSLFYSVTVKVVHLTYALYS